MKNKIVDTTTQNSKPYISFIHVFTVPQYLNNSCSRFILIILHEIIIINTKMIETSKNYNKIFKFINIRFKLVTDKY